MKYLSKIYNFLVFGFLYAPILVMIVYSFNAEKSRTNFGGFSLRWYAELFNDQIILKSLYISLLVALLSAIIATVIGTLASVGIHSMHGVKKRAYLAVNNIPVTNPDIVTAISMMVLFVFVVTHFNKMQMGFGTLLISHITFNIPYVILSVMPKLRGLNPNISEAAQDLGCPPAKAFLKVVIPQISEGIVTGFIMAFTLSLDDFVISYFNSGSTAQTLPVTIYSMTKRPYSPKINALSTLLFLSVMILLVIVNLRKKGGGESRSAAHPKRRIVAFVLAGCILFSLMGYAGYRSHDKVTINVYNWGEYIDEEVLDIFEEQTGIHVNYTTYASNEEMYAKVSSGAALFDVVIPSDYMIDKMLHEDMLAELDFDNIPNYKYIGEDYKGLEYDPDNQYTVPYTWGTTVIIYNTKMVDPEDVAEQSVNLLWNEKYAGQILMFDNPRDAFGLALKKYGYSMNTTNPDEWKPAAEALKEQKPLVQAYVMDQIFDKMSAGEAAIAPYYAGDALIIQEDNPDVDYYIPKEGANFFVDAMCILKNSTHKTEAEAFINFMCEPEIATRTADYIGYATPHTAAREMLDPEITANPVVYADSETLKDTEVFLYLEPKVSSLQSELWTAIKKD